MQKTPAGRYVVVEAVGGKRNSNIVPVMILEFSEEKWNKIQKNDLTLGEVLYENDKPLREALDVEFNKKNRVTVAQFASDEAIANTPRSPQFTDIISQDEENVNNKFSRKATDSADPVTYDDDGNIIPISERFNPENEDIRFSRKYTPEDARAAIERVKSDEGTEAPRLKEYEAMTRGQIKKFIADFSKNKRCSKKLCT